MPRTSEHSLHLPHVLIESKGGHNLSYLFALRVVRDLVNKLALFFLPIFLFQFGIRSGLLADLPLSDLQRGVLANALYYLVSRFVVLVTAVPLGNWLQRVGHQKMMQYSYLLHMIGFVCLYLSTGVPLLIIPAAILDGFQANMFWTSYHTVLSQSSLKQHMGRNLGALQVILQLVGVISPALSGIIAVTSGLSSLFLVALAGTILGYIFTLQITVSYKFDKVSWKEFFTWLKESEFRKLTVSVAGRYINDAAIFLWPLYVYIALGAVDKVGYLYTTSLFLAMLFSFFLGAYIDKAATKRPYLFSGSLLSAMWLVRTQLFGPLGIALVDFFDRLTSNFHWLFFDMILMRRSKGRNALSYFVYREMVMSITAFFFWTIFALFFIIDLGWSPLFIFAAVSVMMSLLINERTPRDV